jgi:hypothetical protein
MIMTTVIDKPKKDPKVSIVDYQTFTDYLFIPPSTFYIQNAMGEYWFVHTSSRVAAQEYIDSVYGKGRYTVVASKLQKTVSKSESGELSCRGTATRKK